MEEINKQDEMKHIIKNICIISDIQQLTLILDEIQNNEEQNYIIQLILNYSWINGSKDIIKYLIEYCENKNIRISSDFIFVSLEIICKKYVSDSQIHILKYLLEYYYRHNYKIDTKIMADNIFCYMCMADNVDTVKYVIEYCIRTGINLDIQQYNDAIFRRDTCGEGSINVAKYLIDYYNEVGNPINIHICY